MSQHTFLAAEYGRTAVQFELIACEPLRPNSRDFTAELVNIMQSVPASLSATPNLEVLVKAAAMPVKSPFLSLLRADACFCIYRKLRSRNIHLPADVVSALLDVIRVALNGVSFLCSRQHPWWNIIGTPFHSTASTSSLSLSPILNGRVTCPCGKFARAYSASH